MIKKILVWCCILYCNIINLSCKFTKHNHNNQITKEDSLKINQLLSTSYKFVYSNPDSSLLASQKALIYSQKINYALGEADSYWNKAIAYQTVGDYKKAHECIQKSILIYEVNDNKKGLAKCYNTLGTIDNQTLNFDNSLKYFYKSKLIATAISEKRLLLLTNLNIGDSYEKKNILDSARLYTHNAYDLAIEFKDNDIRGVALSNLGNIHSKLNQFDIALAFYKQSLNDLLAEEELDVLCDANIGIANIFKHKKNIDSSAYYANKSIEIATAPNFTKQLLAAYDFLAELYRSNGETDSAYKYLALMSKTNELLFSQEKIRELQSLNFAEVERESELEQKKIKEAKERSNTIKLGFISIFIPTFSGFVFLLSRKKKKNSKIITLMGLASLLMLFEFISLLIHPYIESITNHDVAIMYLILLIIASLLVPIHHRLEKYVKDRLAL